MQSQTKIPKGLGVEKKIVYVASCFFYVLDSFIYLNELQRHLWNYNLCWLLLELRMVSGLAGELRGHLRWVDVPTVENESKIECSRRMCARL